MRFQEDFGSGPAHFAQGLANGGQGGILEGGALNVVESDDGDIFGNVASGLVQGADRAHGGNIVEGEQGGEFLSRSEQYLGGHVSELGGRRIAFELRDQAKRRW